MRPFTGTTNSGELNADFYFADVRHCRTSVRLAPSILCRKGSRVLGDKPVPLALKVGRRRRAGRCFADSSADEFEGNMTGLRMSAMNVEPLSVDANLLVAFAAETLARRSATGRLRQAQRAVLKEVE